MSLTVEPFNLSVEPFILEVAPFILKVAPFSLRLEVYLDKLLNLLLVFRKNLIKPC
ncbi:hypothetical protein [Nostoc sp. 'Peltigera membranacea cyanobiont' 213]|uniref:hypothetical protein n=1 Tax=Nostoc sp. 'Peltigera membranacea cyanobiont' 213 TaxID=2014530 RepID=UPI001CB8DECD|nr:hypothetical protein [Nostoc sp. 'Peltigera membranacea cyanobiont' 213]